MHPRVRVKIHRAPSADGLPLPAYKTDGSSGADVCAAVDAPVVIPAGGRALIPTGLSFELPAGYELQVRPRSGLAHANGVTLANSPGTLDADYRGELHVNLVNHGREAFTVQRGDRIAQVVVAPVARAEFEESAGLTQTKRGTGGHGSTGTRD